MTLLETLGVVLPFVGTILLAGLYYSTLQQQKRQTAIQSLAYLPQMVVETQEEEIENSGVGNSSSKNWFCLRNNGDVPFEVSVSIALAEFDQLDPNSNFLDKEASFDSINDEYKFKTGDGSWIDDSEFLNPGDTKRWKMSMFTTEISIRHDNQVSETLWCVRVDAELDSTLDPVKEHNITRLFDMYLSESPNLVPVTYEQIRAKVQD